MEPGLEHPEAVVQISGASSSSSSAAKARVPSSPSTSSSAKVLESLGCSAGKFLPASRAQDMGHPELDLDRSGNQASTSSASPPPADMGGLADLDEEHSAEDFEDALEEPEPSGPEAKSIEEHTAVVLAREPTLQVPAMARADWNAEMQALRKMVDGAETPDAEKVRLLHEALGQRIEDLRALEEHRTAVEKGLDDLAKERDRYRKEGQASVAVKAKLEESCRELQQLKVTITQENKKIVEDEKARQNELNEKFQSAMKDVHEKMGAETEIREHFIKENDELRTKLEKFTETYEEQERHLAEQCATRVREMNAAQERLREYEAKSTESKVNAGVLEKKNKVLQKTTVALRAELQSILSKFDEFHESVNGSSQKHGECKSEIDGLSARLKELEDENVELKGNVRANELGKEKESTQKQCVALEKLVDNLQKEIEKIRERLVSTGAVGKKGGG